MATKFLSRDEALKLLQMTGEQLDGLVAEGELRAFRDGGAIRFKAEDLENLKKRSETDATVVLGGAKKAPVPADDETSEVDLDSVEVDSEADETDQTSILPLDVPDEKEKEEAVLDLDESPGQKAGGGPSLAAVLEESPTVERPKKPADDSDITSAVLDEKAAETDHGIDLAEVNRRGAGTAETDVASSLLDIVEEERKTKKEAKDKKGVTGLLMEAEKESATKATVTAETVGLEPASEAELGTVAIEPVEAAGGAEETVPMEAATEEAATEAAPSAPGAEMAGPMPGGLSLDDFLRDVEPEGMPVKIGLILSGVVLVYSAILVYGIHAGANNALTQWLTSVVRQFFSQ